MNLSNPTRKGIRCPHAGCLFTCDSHYALLRHKCKGVQKRRFVSQFSRGSSAREQRNAINRTVNGHGLEANVGRADVEDGAGDNGEQVCGGAGDSGGGRMAVIEAFCKLAMDCSDYRTVKMLKTVIQLINDDNFDLSLFQSKIPNIDACLRFGKNKFNEDAAKDGFQKNLVQYHFKKENYTAEYFSRNILTVLKEQVAMCREEDILWSPTCKLSATTQQHDESISSSIPPNTHPLQLKYFKAIHDSRMMEVMSSEDPNVMWHTSGTKKSFIGFMQMFTDKTVTTMKIGGIAAHVVHATFLNFSKDLRRKLIHTGKTIVGFLPTGTASVDGKVLKLSDRFGIEEMTEAITEHVEDDEAFVLGEEHHDKEDDQEVVELLDKVVLTSTTAGRRIKLGILHNSMLKILQPALDVCHTGFSLQAMSRTWICYPLFISYCCDIPEAKDMGGIRNSQNTKTPCQRCLVTNQDIRNLSAKRTRLYSGTRHVRQEMAKQMREGVPDDCVKENGQKYSLSECCDNILKKESVYPLPSFLELLMEKHPKFLPPGLYEIFTYEPLHNMHLGISKLLKTMTYELIGSGKNVKFFDSKKKGETKFSSKRIPVLRACNSLLRAIERDSTTSAIHVDFSTKEASSGLNGIFLDTGIRGMLEGMDYRNLDYVFPFVAAFIDRISGCEEDGITVVHTTYSKLLFQLFTEIERTGVNDIQIRKVAALIRRLKSECKRLFDPYVDKGLYTLKFHLLDHVVEDLSKYGSLDYLNAGPYEYFNTVVKQHYRETSKRKTTALEETATRMSHDIEGRNGEDERVKRLEMTTDQRLKKNTCAQYLPRYGLKGTLRELRTLSTSNTCVPDVAGRSSRVCTEILLALPPSDVAVFIGLLDEHVRCNFMGTLDFDINITLVKTGYIEAFQTPSLSSFDYRKCKVKFSADGDVSKARKRVFAASSFGASRKKMYSTVFIRGGDDGRNDEFWFAKVLLLFRLESNTDHYEQELALVQYYTCTQPADEIDNILDCICLRWESEDGLDHSSDDISQCEFIEAGEHYGLIPFQSICGTCDVVRANYAIAPFTTELPWTHHRFYVNRFVQ